jgi:chemotaxis-related protein WspD
MTTLPAVAPLDDCWNRIGVRGDRSCPELPAVGHCHNCSVFAAAGRRFLDAPSPPGYLEAWTERLAAPLEETARDQESVLTFRLGEEWLALPVAVLVEVTELRPVHRVPFRAGLLAGLVNIRGDLHLCMHLAGLLGITLAPAPGRGRLLVVRRDSERWVFPVEEVGQVQRYPAPALRPVPATVARSSSRLSRGILSCGGRLIGVLDEERLFEALRTKLR